MNEKTEVYAVVTDLHWSYVNPKALEITHKILRDLKPDVLITLGDSCDYDGIFKYTMKDYGAGVDECEEELKSFKIGWNELLKSAGNPKQKMCLGNHEGARVEKLLSKLKAKNKSREYRDVKRALDFKEHFKEAQIVNYNDYIKVGGMLFTHGEFHNNNHAKTHALRYGSDVMYGHLHTLEVATIAQKAKTKVQAYSIPCLCQTNPTYRENRSSSWVNGMAVVTFMRGKHFVEVVQYKNNKVIFRGKQYD